MTLPDKDSIETYGGALEDYSEPVNPKTDESAAYRNKYAANVAMMTHTIPRGARSFLGTTGGATGVADPTSGFIHDNVYGDAGSVKLIASYVTTGTYFLTAPTAVNDELGVQHLTNIRRAWAAAESSDGYLRVANAKVSGAQQITVYTYEDTGAPAAAAATGLLKPSQLVGQVITVFFI